MTPIATTTATTPLGVTYLVDDLGFPCEPCPRCTGRGELPVYSHNHAGVCFGCKGAGIRYPKGKAGTIAAEFRAARRPTPVAGDDLAPGMTIRPARRHRAAGDVDEWRTIATAKRTALIVGTTRIDGVERWDLLTFEHYVTYTNGDTERVWCQSLESRADVERLDAELAIRAAVARTTYERLLDRRAAKAAAA